MRTFLAVIAFVAMCLSAFLVTRGGPPVVGIGESATVWGAGSLNCVQMGTPASLCTVDQACNPTVVPPVEGMTQYYENGTPVAACYMPTGGYLYCPCGTSSYNLDFVGTASCYTGS